MSQNDIIPIRGWAIAAFVVILPLLLLAAVLLMRDRSMLAMLSVFFAAGLAALCAAVAPMGWQALPALGFRHVGWQPIVLGTLAAIFVSVATSQFGIEPEGMRQAMEVARGPHQLAASFAVMALLAPLVEELVFRGLLYGWLEGRWGGGIAWIVSSLAFAGAHVELAHVILVLPLGLWLGWLRRRTGSLWPSLVAHVVNNGLAVVAAALL